MRERMRYRIFGQSERLRDGLGAQVEKTATVEAGMPLTKTWGGRVVLFFTWPIWVIYGLWQLRRSTSDVSEANRE